MKRLMTTFVLVIMILTLASCKQEGYFVREDNELYSDLHRGSGPYSRIYSMNYIVAENSNVKKAKDKPLSEMKRFVFREEPGYGSMFSYVLDTHSKRIYCGYSNVMDVYDCEWIVDLTQSDIDCLVSKLTTLEVQNWQEKKKNGKWGSSEYIVGIEYNDGSVERHCIEGEDDGISALLSYFEAQKATFKNRMLNDRKTTVNIDYLVSYLGWDPSRGSDEFNINRPVPLLEIPPLEIGSIERIVIFEAEEPHDVLDHSRNKQKTLFLDILNGKVYYEPEAAIYEKTYNASDIRDIAESEIAGIISLLTENLIEWKANELYHSDEDYRMHYMDIPAWSIGIQYSDGTIVHFSGDGIGEGGWAPGARELLDALFAAIEL